MTPPTNGAKDSDSLSTREVEVLRMASQGLANHEIARRLRVSLHVVKFHLATAFRKLDVNNRTEAVAEFLRREEKGKGNVRSLERPEPAGMDLRLFMRVMWRYRLVVGIGLAVATLLAVLAWTTTTVTYKSTASLLVTRAGFPWGRAYEPYVRSRSDSASAVPSADQTRLTNLATLYSEMANSDRVRALVARSGPVGGTVTAAPVVPSFSSTGPTLPLLTITAVADSAARATSLARREVAAFRSYLVTQQQTAAITPDERVLVQVLRRPERATIAQGRKKTLPVIIFLAAMTAAIGLAFVLENLRNRVRLVPDEQPVLPHPAVAERAQAPVGPA